MKILITGSSGFIGQALTERLSTHELYHLKSDLNEHDLVRNEVLLFQPDIIVHLAARTEVQDSFYEQVTFSEINYVGTVNLIEVAKNVPNLRNFVFASTMEVYGWQPISDEIENNNSYSERIVFDENTEPNPNAPYAVAKLACEKYLQYANRAYGLPFTALRQTNGYGRHDNNFFVVEQIISQMLTSDVCNLGYSSPYRNFIYIEDMMDVWQTVIENPEKCNDGSIFTIGPDNAIQIKELANLIAKKLNWKGKINWNTKPDRPGEIYWLNSGHKCITEKLGWKPKTSLEDGIEYTIEKLKNIIKESTLV